MRKWFDKTRDIFIGMVIGLLIFGGVANAQQGFLLNTFDPRYVINGQEVHGSDKTGYFFNGQTYVPLAFIYNGTTYVPLRFVAEALGEQVNYKGETRTIYVGQVPEQEAQYMSDILSPFYCEYRRWTDCEMTLAGQQYYKGFKFQNNTTQRNEFNTVSFNLNGKYNNIDGLIGIDDNTLYGAMETFIQVYGDDNLIETYTVKSGELPKKINLDVTGVVKLDIKMKSTWFGDVNFANLMIK